MKTPLPRFCLAFTAALLLSQCVSSSPQSRIERNPQLFSQLTAKDRQLVTSGVIREGMTRNAVFLAWGSPNRVSVGSNRGKELESWTYVGQQPVRTMNMNMGFGYGGFGYGGFGNGGFGNGGWGPGGFGGYGGFPYYGGGQSVTYIPYTAGMVEFSRGRVTRWQASQR